MQNRSIKALSPEKVSDLLAGNGAGYALAAELNSYPGPKHVLDLSKELHLTQSQVKEIKEQFAQMQKEAKEIGKQIVSLEKEMDEAFASGNMAAEELNRFTWQIGESEGKLRETHLRTHLTMKEILTAEQIVHYNELRGYTKNNEEEHSHH